MNDPWRTIDNPVTGEQVTFLETTDETGGARVVLDLTLAPGGAVRPHAHTARERFACLAGRLTTTIDGRRVVLQDGDEATAEPDVVHELRNETDEPATVRVTAIPHGDLEAGLRTAFGLARAGRVPANGPPKDLLVFALLAKRSGLYLPPLPRWLYWPLMGGLAALGQATGAEKVVDHYTRRPG